LKRIIRAIEFHGRLGLPLRGHRDSGDLFILNDGDASSGSNLDETNENELN